MAYGRTWGTYRTRFFFSSNEPHRQPLSREKENTKWKGKEFVCTSINSSDLIYNCMLFVYVSRFHLGYEMTLTQDRFNVFFIFKL